jgi:hypothetical protein
MYHPKESRGGTKTFRRQSISTEIQIRYFLVLIWFANHYTETYDELF